MPTECHNSKAIVQATMLELTSADKEADQPQYYTHSDLVDKMKLLEQHR